MIILITNSIIPYCYDIGHVMALPENFTHRFRYHNKWLEKKLANEYKDQNGVVVFRDIKTGKFTPIRYVQVNDVISIGNINYIEFQLKRYIPISDREMICDSLDEKLISIKCSNSPNKPLATLVLDTDVPASTSIDKIPYDENALWDQLTNCVGQMDCFKDYAFLKILSLKDSSGDDAKIRKDERGQYSYSLWPDRLYLLDVMQQIPWKIEVSEEIDNPFDITLITEDDALKIKRRVQRVVGKYDLLRFSFKTPYGYFKKYPLLRLESQQSGIPEKYGLASIFLPTTINPTGLMKFLRGIRLLMVITGIATLFFTESLSSHYCVPADIIRGLSILFIVIGSGKWDEFVSSYITKIKG